MPGRQTLSLGTQTNEPPEAIITARRQTRWRSNSVQHDWLNLHFGSDGGPNIVAGTSPKDFLNFRVQKIAKVVYLAGQPIGDNDLVVLPPGQRYAFASSAPHTWISVSLPQNMLRSPIFRPSDVAGLIARPSLVRTSSAQLRRIVSIAGKIRANIRRNGALDGDTLNADLAEELIETIVAVLADRTNERPNASHKRRRHLEQIAFRALDIIEERSWTTGRVSDLCGAIGTAERPLRRAFHTLFGIAPVKFLRIYKLNRVRRTLLDSASRELTVSSVLASHNITELGRFAGEYRALFGELPSVTRKKQIALLTATQSL
jgi:AraC-like DNA-binding protein